jgi:arsenate reductase (glutaredoxin)
MTTTLYGIPNCDTVKKARTWLDQNGVPYEFHDFKKAGVNRELLVSWLRDVPRDVLVNRKGTTWRALSDERKSAIVDDEHAIALMLESPAIIKRPVLVTGKLTGTNTHVGFSAETYQQILKK